MFADVAKTLYICKVKKKTNKKHITMKASELIQWFQTNYPEAKLFPHITYLSRNDDRYNYILVEGIDYDHVFPFLFSRCRSVYDFGYCIEVNVSDNNWDLHHTDYNYEVI